METSETNVNVFFFLLLYVLTTMLFTKSQITSEVEAEER